ncbi:hypothetical protein Sango_1090100 [Sesamum angolense]|uniref:Uncharacterized protein n=1 Tax=Sesamum angolense TaxID=2727404 RepID=A0AAE1WUM5_9LAMI|nr:hypothetical protein Sango_1090100 [Sesamum angolense]
MVESRNLDRAKSPTLVCQDCQQEWSLRCNSNTGDCNSSTAFKMLHQLGCSCSCNNDSFSIERLNMSFHKSLDLSFRITAKFLLVILLFLLIFALPTSAAILMLYLVSTILFVVPAFLVLYFAYPALDWLQRQTRT